MNPALTIGTGLTRAQAWTEAHIHRCGTCGAWTVVSDRELVLIRDDKHVWPTVCKHLTTKEKAA